MLDNATGVIYHPAITYAFDMLQQIFIAAVGLITFLVAFIYLSKYKKSIPDMYLFLLFMGTASVTALMLTDDILTCLYSLRYLHWFK